MFALRPLRVYLLILVLGAMLPGALLTGFLVWRAFDNNRVASERRLLESARVDASALDRFFSGTIGTLQALATSPALDRNDLEAFHADGQRVQATQPGWYSVVLSALDGRQLVSTRVPWGGPLIRGPEPDSMQRLFTTRQPVVGTIRPSPRGGPELLFAVRVPVLRDGALKYSLSAIIDIDSLAVLVPQHQTDTGEWTRTVLDSDGTIAVRTRGRESYVGSPASEAFRERIRQTTEFTSNESARDGTPVYAAASRGKFGWTAVVVATRSGLDTALRASMMGVLTGGALLMMCGLVAVFVVSRRLSADLAGATAAAEAVAEGRTLPPARAHVAETLRLQGALASASSLLEKRGLERDEQIQQANTMRAQAESANRTKDQFLAVLGHELRNPLAPAVTALELMKLRDPRVFTREREVLERQVAHLSRLVNDLLDISRFTRGKVQLQRQRFELREAVDRAVDMVRPAMARQEHAFTVSVPAAGLTIDGDIDRIVQVLSNLLSNAVKYTPPGGEVLLAATPMRDRVRIVCEDNGPGVSRELGATLFEAFQQGPRTLDRRDGGLGLGLALARTFTELHGGTLHLEKREHGDHGSRFVVILPLAASTATATAATPLPPRVRHSAQRVLVVDDNRDASDMLRAALESAGHHVSAAASGPEAIAKAREFQPDIAVLDIGLPGMNGYELARELRAMRPAIRLIALTGYGQNADRAAAAAAGFDAHCTKPVTTSALLDQIEGRQPARG